MLKRIAICLILALTARAGAQVLGGQRVRPGEIPFVAAIATNAGPPIGRSYFCGGTIIATRWVLTAAHCLVGANGQRRPIDNLEVTAGVERLSLAGEGNHYRVAAAFVHPRYDSRSQANDIALLRLARDWTGPVARLPQASEEELFGLVTVAGFGATAEGQARAPTETRTGERLALLSDDLMAAELVVSPLAQCVAGYRALPAEEGFGDLSITEANICARGASAGRDACQGDSGGPLLVREGRALVQVGIASFGYGCAVPDVDGVYTRISAFSDWIAGEIRRFEESGSKRSRRRG